MDQRPDYIPLEQIDSTICINLGGVAGSAVILDAHHLLTCTHVFGHETDQAVSVFGICTSSGTFDQRTSDFLLVDAGELDVVAENSDSESDWARFKSDSDSDWALIKTDKPRWDAKSAAVIHPAAVDPEWVIPEGTELFALGYSSIFMEATPQDSGHDAAEPSDTISGTERFLLHIENGPYTLRGRAFTSRRGLGGILPSEDWPVPVGHSGGGVYVWNADAERLELVGVFNSGSKVRRTFHVFGSIHVPLGESIFLLYSPIAPALQALK